MLNIEKAIIKLPSRNTINSKAPKPSARNYEKELEKVRKENEDLKDQVKSLQEILTSHKKQIKSSSETISTLKSTLAESSK